MSSDAPEKEKGELKHVPGGVWLEIYNLAERGMSVPMIAKLFKIAPSTIYRRFKQKGIVVGSRAALANEEVADKDREELVKRIKETRDGDFRLTVFLQQRAAKLIADADRDSKAFASQTENLKALDLAMKIVKAGTDNKWRLLGLDKDNADLDRELPELPIREMSQEEVEKIRDAQILEDLDLDEQADGGEADEDIAEEEGED